MQVDIYASVPHGSVQAPPSKSIAHRLIILAALAKGESMIGNIDLSDDINATLRCIKTIGAFYSYDNGTPLIRGIDPHNIRISETMECGECGSTLRFMIPVCMLSDREFTLTGSKTLLSRPLTVYEDICRINGILFENSGNEVHICGKLRSGDYSVPGDISSQFITGLLFALPLLSGESRICLTGKIESRPYIDLTLVALRRFGVEVSWQDERTLFVPGDQYYTPCQTENEGDWSNAAFLYALKYCGYPIEISGVNINSLQGDKICSAHFHSLSSGYAEIDISDCPDLGPILFSFAALQHGGRFTGTKRLKIKESDRAAAMAEELRKCGVQMLVEENEVVIRPSALHAPNAPFYGHNDHRIVMSLAVISIITGGVIQGAEAVKKSYPGFFEDLRKMQVKLKYETE